MNTLICTASAVASPLSLSSGPAATPIAFVQAIVHALERAQIDPTPLLQQAQIAPAQLENPQSRITAWQFERLSDLAMRTLDDEALGWFERRLPWGSYGMLVRASISSPTLGVALRRWCRHHNLLTEAIALQLETRDGMATLSLTERQHLGLLREFCLVSVLRNAHGVACWLIDSRIPLQGAQFPFAAPPHQDVYPLLFPGPVQWGSNPALLRFDARYLNLPLARDEAALRQMLQRALPLTVLQYRRDRLLVQRVRQVLAADPGASHSAEALALRLHLSPRTLHRQLKEEGASLQALKDEVRRERAISLLHRTERPIKQVAHDTGFTNDKSFIRAFRGWTGQSPAEFRRNARQGA
ncbi:MULTISPECIES: AraC family transcriptional regulator [Giesbergeria]|uniref:AraC family transcriptional regulator n=1 Tax=Giesbergeria sinuosa TaxID=80883 RepID=A0ABV9QED6_9BURK